jgi:hypothetical protein
LNQGVFFPVFVTAILVACLPTGKVFAQDSNGPTNTIPLIHFSIKPRLCVLNAAEEVCRDELQVRWESPVERSLCLFQSEKPTPLRCWENARHGEFQFELTASVTTDFQLREQVSDKPLSAQQFQVVYNDKKFRRARRNPWSFF